MTDRSEILAWAEDNMAHELAAARRQILAQTETGYPDWYESSLQNSGTKWNSYWFAWVSAEPIAFSFCTAWSFPHPIFAKLAALHPELTFDCLMSTRWETSMVDQFTAMGPSMKTHRGAESQREKTLTKI